jgi:alpha-glucosidase
MKVKIWQIIILFIGVVAAGVWLTLWGMEKYNQRQADGRLSFDAKRLPSQDYSVGSFTVRWQAKGDGFLSVYHQSNPSKPLWQSLPGRSFLSAGRGVETVKESRGSFIIKDKLQSIIAEQSITDIKQAKGELTISGMISGGSENVPYTFTFSEHARDNLRFNAVLVDKRINRSFLTYRSEQGEHFFGFGEQFSYFDMKGRRLPIFCQEQGVGRGDQPITTGANLTAGAGGDWHTSYAGVPHYITSKLRSLYLDSSAYVTFDMRRDDRVQVQLFAGSMAGHILNGNSPQDLILAYTAASGRMRPLPDWITSGAVVGMQGGTDKVRLVWQQLRQYDTPVAAFWLQDWVGQRVTSFGKQLWWNWEVDTDRYPRWNALIADLNKSDIRMMTYISPFLVDVTEKGNSKRNLYKEAENKGYLVKNKEGEAYPIKTAAFNAGLLDLSNPAAYNWMKGVIKEQVIGAGAKGWMADFAEGLPYESVLYSGEPPSSYHNRYPEIWAKLNREAINEAGLSREAVFFTRAGYTRSPGYSTLFWLGDQMVSWGRNDGIKSAVTGLISSGMSGFSFNHSDIGGYTTINNPVMNYHRSKELLLRWMELNAFTVVYRTHEGNLPEANAQFYTDDDTLKHFSRFARVYVAWQSFRSKLIQEASATGLPVVRHPFIHYPADPNVYGIHYQQFMVGSEFMVVPVLDEGQSKVRAYLPAGEWVHIWSGKLYGNINKGIYIEVDAPLGKPAVFYRAGSVAGEKFVADLKAAKLL